MKINDPERFARELRGDFSEVDAYLRRGRIKMLLISVGIALCVLLAWLLP
jgi:hypothetical protein